MRSVLVVILMYAATEAHAGGSGAVQKSGETLQLTGSIRIDLFGQRALYDHPHLTETSGGSDLAERKSPWVAAGLSAILPGAGEFYAESYWKAALFLAIEVTAWALVVSYNGRGDQQTEDYETYADASWATKQYADYTVANARAMNGSVNPADYAVYNPDQSVNYSELNRLERDIGGWYSHTLPAYGTQQYYELIGKYPQFFSGWNDANTSLPPNYIVVKANLSPNFQWYSAERGKANDYYATAKTFVTVAVVNHVLSAVDAALTAGSYNRTHVAAEVRVVPLGNTFGYVPALRITQDFTLPGSR